MVDINNTTYFEDKKLHHVVISDVWYIDDDSDESFPAKLELFGHSLEIIAYKNGKPYNTIRGSQIRGSQYSWELTYLIIKSDKNTVTLEVNDNKLRLSWANFKILKAYYDEKNVVYIQAEGAFKDEILSMLPKLFEDSELVQMVSNFIEKVPTVFYLDSTFIISTEYLIACLIDRQAGIGDKGNSLFLSDELQRSTVLKLE